MLNSPSLCFGHFWFGKRRLSSKASCSSIPQRCSRSSRAVTEVHQGSLQDLLYSWRIPRPRSHLGEEVPPVAVLERRDGEDELPGESRLWRGVREPRDWGAFKVSKEATRMQEESPGRREVPLAHASEQTPAGRGASRGSAEQRRTEQSWRTGRRQRRTEQRQQWDTVLDDLAADRPVDTGGRQRSPRWQEGEQLPSA